MEQETKVGAAPKRGSAGPARQGPPKGSATVKTATSTKSAGPNPGHIEEPTSPGETRRSLHLAGKAIAKLMGSSVDLKAADFEEMGDSFDTIANKMAPQLRIAIRIIAPLILAGAVVEVGRKILEGTTWYPAWRESRRRRRAEKERAAQPQAVAKDPVAATKSTPPANGTAPVAEVNAPTEPAAVAQPVVPARPIHGLSRGIRL